MMWNLNYTWLAMGSEPPLWNVLVTQQVSSIHVEGNVLSSIWDQVQVLGQALNDPPQGMFFRIVTSTEPLGLQSLANGLYVMNSSTSVLSNVTFGEKHLGGYNPTTNIGHLAQSETSQVFKVWEVWNPAGGGSTVPMASPTPVQEGWYVSYDQNGSNRVAEGSVLPFGPTEMNVILTVSNSAVTVKPDWLTISWTLNY
jgi:hypothetical protein